MTLGVRRGGDVHCACAIGARPWTRPFFHYWVSAPSLAPPNYGTSVYLYRYDGFYVDHCKWRSVADHFSGPSNEELQLWPVYSGGDPIGFRWFLIIFDISGSNSWEIIETWPQDEWYPVDHEGEGSLDRMQYKLPHTAFGPLLAAELRPGYFEACDDGDYPAKQQSKPLTWQP